MRTYPYLHYDVFTDAPFEGNQLAVFLEPAGLTTGEMQIITREMNFSECTFVFPADAPHPPAAAEPTGGKPVDVRMRIFTPGEELPMAGHPTIGTTFALAQAGVIKPGRADFVFGLGVGPTPVSLAWQGDVLDFVWMTQTNPQFGGEIHDRADFARTLGLAAQDLAEVLPQQVSCGVPFLFAALTSRTAVDRVCLDATAYAAACRAEGIEALPLFIFTTADAATGRPRSASPTSATGGPGDAAVYSRMLAPGFGIAEDPATGGASGPLGCYVFRHRLVPRERLAHFISLQGVQMRRPSRIHISIEARDDAITGVRVGGRSVLVGDGRLAF